MTTPEPTDLVPQSPGPLGPLDKPKSPVSVPYRFAGLASRPDFVDVPLWENAEEPDLGLTE